jgi:hypothetical protein
MSFFLWLRVPAVYPTWVIWTFLAFFSFNGIKNLRVFNVAISSIPTAPTSFLFDSTGLAKSARQQKAAIRARMRWSVGNSEWHGWHTDAYPLNYDLPQTSCSRARLCEVGP